MPESISADLTRFSAAWARSFPLAPPLGYALPGPYAARWLRVHSLPESKRYPEGAAEYAEVLARHNAVASALFGEGGRVVFVVASYGDAAGPYPDPDGPGEGADLPAGLAGPLARLRRVDPRELDPAADTERDEFVYLDAARATWQAGAFDALIRRTADDAGPRWLLAGEDAEHVYAPYDGGADLILPTRAARDALRVRFAGWQSAHPAGL